MLNGSERGSFEYIWCFLMVLYNIEFSYDLSLQIFKYLDSVDVDDSDVKAGYSIHLVSTNFSCSCIYFPHCHMSSLVFSCLILNWQNFSENPYFEDTKLTKTYSFADDGTTIIKASQIKWKEGMVLLYFQTTPNTCVLDGEKSNAFSIICEGTCKWKWY